MRVNGCFTAIDVLFSFAAQQMAREGGGVEQQALDSVLADEQLALFGRRSASRKFRATWSKRRGAPIWGNFPSVRIGT